MIFILFFIILMMFYVNFRMKRRRLYELAEKIPGTNGLPLVGHMFSFIKLDLENNLQEGMKLLKNNLPVSKIWAGSELFVIVNSADHSQALLQSSACLKIPFMFSRPFLARYGLVLANGKIWQKHRKILSHSFKLNILQKLMPIFNEKSKKCIRNLEPKVGTGEFNISKYIAALTLETTMTGNFNYDHNFYGSKIIDDIDEGKALMMKRLTQPWWNWEWLFQKSKLFRDMNSKIAELHEKIDEIMEENKITQNNNNINTFVIDQLMDPKSDLSYEEIRDEIYIFILAGYETSSVTLSAILLLLAIHKDVQQKLINEVDEFYDGESNIDMEDLHKFKYVEMVVKESLRIFPTIPIVPRKVTEEFQLNEHRIPKDAILIEFVYAIHRNENHWGKDAHLFKPERMDPVLNPDLNPHAYIPFAGGKRMCIGHKYAVNFLKVFLVHFFKIYETSSSLKYENLTPKMTPTLEIAQKYYMTLNKRIHSK